MKGLKYLIGVSALATLFSLKEGIAQPFEIYSEIRKAEAELYEKASKVSTNRIPGMTNMSCKQFEAELPNEIKISALYSDDPNTTASPDNLSLFIYQKVGDKWVLKEGISDNGLDGLIQKEPDFSRDNPFEDVDAYEIHHQDSIEDIILKLNEKELQEKNKRLLSGLTQLIIYSSNPSGKVEPIHYNDSGIQYPDEIPLSGIINWNEILQGLSVASIDVLFHNKLADRIQLLKIDPKGYKFAVHCDKKLKTIEQWQRDLNAVAVTNGSFYQAEDYGEPLTPMMINGQRRGLKKFTAKAGAFLFEPTNQDSPLVKIIDYSTPRTAMIETEGYREGFVSYPTLLDFTGKVRVKSNLGWRATRTFIGMDKEGYIIMGNAQGGFFSLRRLGDFLKSVDELKLRYVLNLDGGPPACMAVKTPNFSYVNYGIWESNDYTGKEELYWNEKNKSKWRIPIVISVKKR